MSTWTYSGANEDNLLKQKYGKMIEKQFNKSNVILGRIKRMEDFEGKGIDRPVIQSIGGGVGNSILPTANENKIGLAQLKNSKKMYAVVSVDRETMKRAKKDEASFVRMTKFPVKIATESFNRNLTRQILKGDITGSGALLTFDTAAPSGTLGQTAGKLYFDTASTHDLALFEAIEIGDLIDKPAGTASLGMEVIDMVVVPSATGYAGAGSYVEFAVTPTMLDGEILYMQNSKDAELQGIKGVVSEGAGTVYKNITTGRRWQSYQKDASAAAISSDLLNELVINIKRNCGESPDLLLTSYHQFIRILNFLEDAKRYNLPARNKKFKGVVSFAGVEFMSADGPIPVVADRFMDADEIFALNTKHIELHLTPGGLEWFDEDGTVFLRESGDAYEARYGGYGELFVNPHFHGRLHNILRT